VHLGERACCPPRVQTRMDRCFPFPDPAGLTPDVFHHQAHVAARQHNLLGVHNVEVPIWRGRGGSRQPRRRGG
jgi:hypothetical protein